MSYKSFTRVLGGETSLERKCRILFGVSLLILISCAFWYAGNQAERLVRDVPTRTGRFFVGEKMITHHLLRDWLDVLSGGTAPSNSEDRDQYLRLAQALSNSLGAENYEWEILVSNRHGVKEQVKPNLHQRVRLAASEEELQAFQALRDQLERQFEEYGRERLLTAPDPAPDGAGPEFRTPIDMVVDDPESPFKNPPSVLVSREHENFYHFYQPILWRPECTAACHRSAVYNPPEGGLGHSRYAYSAADWKELTGDRPEMLRVMKVVIPRDRIAKEIRKTRAILIALAIATVFFSMAALWLVVRYVIAKPLNHLREVSDEIGRGNYDLRANIQTRDEFEELAASFNRMLRHLVDTQAELRNVNIDLDAKVDQLAQANMQLHEMNRVKSDFLSSMSHELRTPLNSIIGFADILRESDNLNSKQQRYASNVAGSGRALLEMINDILDLAKTESGKMEVRLAEFQIEPVVHSQCDSVRSLSEEKNIDLTAQVEPCLPPLYQDQGKIQQILINLLSNAIKFTPEGGRIEVHASRDPMRHLVLRVTDTGVGIAEGERKVIFEKFRQGTQTVGTDHLTREFSGSGLGLSIVKELCKLLGGEVSFESELGKGSTFCIRVPWTLADQPKVSVSITQRLEEVTKPRRLDFSNSNYPDQESDEGQSPRP